MDARWYHLDAENKLVGPFDEEGLLLALDGAVETLVCEDGGTHWRPLAKALPFDSNSALLAFALRVLFFTERGGLALDAAPLAAAALQNAPLLETDSYVVAMRQLAAGTAGAAAKTSGETERQTDITGTSFWNMLHTMLRAFAKARSEHARWDEPGFLDAHPAAELVRTAESKSNRNWRKRWATAGGALFENGRMAAPPDSPVWTKIARWNLPWAPLDIGSRMTIAPLPRPEAERLGVIAPSARAAAFDPVPAPPATTSVNTLRWSREARETLSKLFAGALTLDGTVATVRLRGE
ncbi:MAG: hypothetical protein LBR07_06360 [Puniceicoccales bacterium]|jgi:hypothetical protein|nr:hypothetical protein [Puniceicoccales bacterium]